MAELVAGIGTSHSPMLSMTPDLWAARAGANDQRNRALVGTDGIVSNYEDLLNRTDVERIALEITPEKMALTTNSAAIKLVPNVTMATNRPGAMLLARSYPRMP